MNENDPEKSFEVVKKLVALAPNPFTPKTAPVTLRAKAKKIPAWKVDRFGLVGKLQDSPVKSEKRTERVTLIPMGAARLRISAFPVIGSDSRAHEWIDAYNRVTFKPVETAGLRIEVRLKP